MIWKYCIVFFYLLSFSACDPIQDLNRKSISIGPEEKARDITMEYLDSARIKVKLVAPSLMRQETKTGESIHIFDQGIYVEFYKTSKSSQRRIKESWLTAKWAKQDVRSKRVEVRDDVVLYNIYGDTLMTTELTWDEKKSEVYTSKFVKIKRPNHEVIYSYGFLANQNFTTFEVNAFQGDWQLRDLNIQ